MNGLQPTACMCPWCGRRPLLRSGDYTTSTCTASECQQAAYEANRAAGRRPRRRKVRS